MKQDDRIKEIILKLNGLIKLQKKNGLVIGECLERIDRLDKWIGFKKKAVQFRNEIATKF